MTETKTETETRECPTCEGSGKVAGEWEDSEFEEYLNDAFGDVEVCGLKYPAGRVLREIDEIAFNCAMSETEPPEVECSDCGGSG